MRTLPVCLVLAMATRTAGAEYPTPEEAGFHHCALIYGCEVRGPERLAWYVANNRGWLFDAFLFLHQRGQSGQSTMNGLTVKTDWQGQLDTWFTPGRDLQALDEAIEEAKPEHGAVAPRQVILSIPYPNPKVADFGDVDGDGVTEDLATAEGRGRAASGSTRARTATAATSTVSARMAMSGPTSATCWCASTRRTSASSPSVGSHRRAGSPSPARTSSSPAPTSCA